MGRRKSIHVVPLSGKWAVKEAGKNKPLKVTGTQKEAINYGREVAKQKRSELVIHRRDGKIRDKDSYGNDPCPPKDKKY